MKSAVIILYCFLGIMVYKIFYFISSFFNWYQTTRLVLVYNITPWSLHPGRGGKKRHRQTQQQLETAGGPQGMPRGPRTDRLGLGRGGRDQRLITTWTRTASTRTPPTRGRRRGGRGHLRAPSAASQSCACALWGGLYEGGRGSACVV